MEEEETRRFAETIKEEVIAEGFDGYSSVKTLEK